MDLSVVTRIAAELDDELRGRRIDRVYALPKNDVVLLVGRRSEPRLWLSTEAEQPHIYLRSGPHATPDRPPGFAMAARNLLTNRRIAAVRAVPGERIIEIVSAGDDAVRLVFEAIPRRATILVLDAGGTVRAAWQPRRGRPGLGEAYHPPPGDRRAAVGNVAAEVWQALEGAVDGGELVRHLLRSIAGVTPLIARDITWRRHRGGELRDIVEERLGRAANATDTACVYAPDALDELDALPPPRRFVLAPQPVNYLDAEDALVRTDCDSMLAAAGVYFPLRASLRGLEIARKELESSLRQALARRQRTRDAVADDASKAGDADRHRTCADLLLGYPRAERRDAAVFVPDPSDATRTIAIRIDPARSNVENAQRYYQRARRAQRSRERTLARRQHLQQQLTKLNDLLANLSMVRSVAECTSIARAAKHLGVTVRGDAWLTPEANAGGDLAAPAARGGDLAAPAAAPPARRGARNRAADDPGIDVFAGSDGAEILVGRNAGANERLTHKMAAPRDFWLHAEGPGSHVVIRNPRRDDRPSEEALREAASLAAFYSRSRGATKVNVRWTEARHVKKPKGAPTGQVVLRQSRTVLAQPLPPEDLFSSADA